MENNAGKGAPSKIGGERGMVPGSVDWRTSIQLETICVIVRDGQMSTLITVWWEWDGRGYSFQYAPERQTQIRDVIYCGYSPRLFYASDAPIVQLDPSSGEVAPMVGSVLGYLEETGLLFSAFDQFERERQDYLRDLWSTAQAS